MYNAQIQHGNVQVQSICFSESNFQDLEIDLLNSVSQIATSLTYQ